MEFREFCKEDVIEAAKLLAKRHKNERNIFPELQLRFEDSNYTEKILYELLEDDYFIGICACEDNKFLE